MKPRLLLGVILCELATLSCSPSARNLSHVVRDSAGVTIVESGSGTWSDSEAWRVSDGPITEIGTDANDPQQQLWEIGGVTRLADRRIAVLNAGSGELRFFSTEGDFIGSVGGLGGGPGEFDYPTHLLRLPGDSLLVLDSDLQRSVFSPDGNLVRQEAIDPGAWASLWGADRQASVRGLFPDGSILTWVFSLPTNRGPSSLHRPMGELVRVVPETGQIWRFGWYGEVQQQRIDTGTRVRSIVPPFASFTAVHIGGSPPRLAVGDNESYEVKIFRPDGDLERIVRRLDVEERISASEVEEWKDSQRKMGWTRGQLLELERAWLEMDLPPSKNAYEGLILDSVGNLWVPRRPTAGETSIPFDVFDPVGRFRGQVEVPRGLKIMSGTPPIEIGEDYLLGVWIGDYDEEVVRVFGLRKPGRP